MTAVNKATVDLIKAWEGLRLTAYLDGGGVWTIGYGTTAAADVGIVPRKGMTITEPQAEAYLKKAIEKFSTKIRSYITAPINENEFGAFVSLAYNIGPNAFYKSTALRKFNAGDKKGAVEAIAYFNKDNGKFVQGLANRRKAEIKLFNTPVAPTKTPSFIERLWSVFK